MGLRDKDKWDPLPKDQLNTKPRFHEKKVTVLLYFVQITSLPPLPPIWTTCATFF